MVNKEQIDKIRLELLKDDIFYANGRAYKYNVQFIICLFTRLFNCVPYTFSLFAPFIKYSDVADDAPRIEVDINKSLKNIIKAYPDCYVDQSNLCIHFVVTDSFIVFYDTIYSKYEVLDSKIKYCITEIKTNDSVKFVTLGSNGFESMAIKIKHMDNIDLNYNDDIPSDKIQKILSSDVSSILLFYGKPGTGKTSYIRNLVNVCPNLNFFFLDSSMLNYITDSSFIEYLMWHKTAVHILED